MYEATVVVPTRNEEEVIGKVLRKLKKLGRNYEIIVVDKSEDSTPEICKKFRVRVIRQRSSGKGNAMKLGAKLARSNFLVFIDGDDTYPVKVIPKMLKILKRERRVMVCGSRLLGKWESNFSHKIVNKILSSFFSILHSKTTDLLTGLRAIRKEDFFSLRLESKGFEIETEMHIKASKRGIKIIEIPITYKKRTGKKKYSVVRDTIKILKLLFLSVFK